MTYTPTFRKQLTGTPCAGANCNMASAAMLADRMTLGLERPTPDRMRLLSGTAGTCSDGITGNSGTSQADALRALAKLGLYPTAYQTFDVAKLRASAARGLILSLDYGAVPVVERGDKDFVGNHAIFVNDFRPDLYLRGDPLCDGRRAGIPKDWSHVESSVLEAAAEAYKVGGGNVYCIVNPVRFARRRASVSGVVNVRPTASRAGDPIYRVTTQFLEASHKADIGESIGGNPRWWRVWVPSQNRVGFMHDSVVTVE